MKTFMCECCCKMLIAERGGENMICLATYRFGDDPRFWFRFKQGLKYIFTGKLYADEFVFHQEQADDLAEFLKEKI